MSPSIRLLIGRARRRVSGSKPGDTVGAPTGTQASPPISVPITVRGATRDEDEIRILLDAVVAPSVIAVGHPDLPRITHALVVPAVERWLQQRSLPEVQADLANARGAVEDAVRPEFGGLGATLLRLDLIAVEHLLLSPSGTTTALLAAGRDAPGGD